MLDQYNRDDDIYNKDKRNDDESIQIKVKKQW